MNKKLLRSLLPVMLAMLALPAWSQHAITVPIEVEHVSNPGLISESPGSVTIYRASPRYSIELQSDARSSVLSLGADLEQSSNTELVASRTLPRLGFVWETVASTSVLGFQASLEEASSRSTEFVEFGRVTLDSVQQTGLLGATWSKEVSPTQVLRLASEYRRVRYDSPLLEAYQEVLASANLRTALGDEVYYSVEGLASRLSVDGALSDATRAGLLIGYEASLSDALLINTGLGFIRSSNAVSETSPVGYLRLSYRGGERTTYAFGIDQTVGAGGTVGGYARIREAEASLSYELSANTSMDLGVRRVESRAPAGVAGALGSEGSSATARFRSEISQFWAMTLVLERRRQSVVGAGDANGHSVRVGFVYSHPDF